MTTTYETLGYPTSEALRDAINAELAALAYPFTVKHKINGVGQLTYVKAPLTGGSLYANIEFDTIGSKLFAVDVVLTHRLLDMPEILLETLIEAQTAFKEDFEVRRQAQMAADQQAWEEADVAKKKAAEDKKNEEKYEHTKAKALKDFEANVKAERTINTTYEFYYSLGWLAKHVGSIRAVLPDYLCSAFEKHFGAEAPKTLIDGRAKTIGGHAKHWSWEFRCTIKKLKETTVPAYLQGITTDFSKGIHNTGFLWDLVENYGFQFGPKQDVEKIRSHVPSDCLAAFEAGLA